MMMQLVYKGKTKDVYKQEDGNVLLKFKDDVTGEGGVFDPGANTVGLTMDGAGKAGLRMTKYFFEKLLEQQIPTHYIDADLDKVTMTVRPAAVFGKGLEVICRYKAVGSFYRRYGAYCEEGQALESFVEVTLRMTNGAIRQFPSKVWICLVCCRPEEYDVLEDMTRKISNVIKDDLAQKGLELYDIKLEFGREEQSGQVMLIDEISGGNMRVYDKDGHYIEPLQLEKIVLS